MLRKLQRKVIIINIILVGSIMLIGFSLVCYTAYTNQKSIIDKGLTYSLECLQREELGRPSLGAKKSNTNLPTVTVQVDQDGNYTGTYSGFAYISDSTLKEAITMAYKATATSGKLSSLNLYFQKQYIAGNLAISFADSSQLHATVNKYIFYSVLVFLSSMVIVFLISFLLAKITIRPVRKAWDQQQQFVADASHELKTPLTVILANNNILLSHKKDSVQKQSKWIESSQAEATHMKNLVNHLLYLARSDSNKSTSVFSTVSLTEIVMDCALQFEPVAFEKSLSIETNVNPDINMLGDTTKLKQLIHILIDNACKYGGSNSTVTVSLKKNASNIILSVHNMGNPIDSKDLSHLFERFFRSDKARTQHNQEGGYGLGLAIAKSIVEDHKGKINVTSTEKAGTKFIVQFKG